MDNDKETELLKAEIKLLKAELKLLKQKILLSEKSESEIVFPLKPKIKTHKIDY